jgi:hypothetical protein
LWTVHSQEIKSSNRDVENAVCVRVHWWVGRGYPPSIAAASSDFTVVTSAYAAMMKRITSMMQNMVTALDLAHSKIFHFGMSLRDIEYSSDG